MTHWTIRQRIALSFGAIIVLAMVMAGVAYMRYARIEQAATAALTDSLPGLYHSTQMAAELTENFSITQELGPQQGADRTDTLTGKLRASRAKMDALQKSYAMTIIGTEDRERFEAVKLALGAYLQDQDKLLKATADLRGDKTLQALEHMRLIARDELRVRYDKGRDAIRALVEASKAKTAESARQIMVAITSAQRGILLSFGGPLLVLLLTGYYLLRSVTRPLARLVAVMNGIRQGDFTQRVTQSDEFAALGEAINRMADELTILFGHVQTSGVQVGTSVMEISVTAKEQQATASEIAATTTEIGATSREISATSKELVKTMHDVSTVAEQTATMAGSGQTGLTRMEETMRQVMDAAGSINAKLAVLNEKAGNINQVVTTITKVADQTNLLSLNAAIEAEKAGEYGRGFAVVATEIRRLADQTAVATYDIEQMVTEIQSAVSAGVMGMDKFSQEVRRGILEVQQVGGLLSHIIQQVQALAPRFEAVNEGMQAQATGGEQITQALTQLSEAARQTVLSLQQSSAAIGDLNQVASGLRTGIARFKLQA